MLTAKTQYNLTNAREYFEEHLCVGDYYDEGQRVSGQWIGMAAEQLGLSGKVRADEFLRLCENQHPKTGETLTQRLNTVRMDDGKEAVNRRVFYDFTFSPPKSVSIVALAGADERIVAAHDQAVWSAMRELETFAATRVRAGGGHGDRSTGNVAAALFTHDTSRALDPHLHTHCVVFNATFDPAEQRWKALQNYEMLLAKKFAENVYYHELARQLKSFGYEINNHPRGDFQIEGVSEEICDRFSKRDAEVDKALAKLLAEKPELAGANLKEIPLDQLAYAQMDTDGKEQLLHLSFATHEIIVRGNTLRRIETALHRLELSFITPLPAKYHSLVADGQPRIREIVVTEIKPGVEPSQLN